MAPSSDFPVWDCDLILQSELVVVWSSASNKPLYTVTWKCAEFPAMCKLFCGLAAGKELQKYCKVNHMWLPAALPSALDHRGWMRCPVSSSERAGPTGKEGRACRSSLCSTEMNCSGLNWGQKTLKDETILYGDTSQSREGTFSAGVMASSIPSYRGPRGYTWVSV